MEGRGSKKDKYLELPASTVAFISCRRRLKKVLAGAARGEKGNKGGSGGGQVMLLDVDTGRLSGLKYKLIYFCKLAADMVSGGIREFVNDTDGPAILERELLGSCVDGYW